ncbi:MAG TPA: hypothetical protein VFC78_11255 [Tepidisphaeraceae bacterium]|nr:hypothetical protein [Tepidisphaeraceae bacterium]
MSKRFDVLVGCYGDYPQYSLRCLDSIAQGADRAGFGLRVGCSACGERTLVSVRQRYDEGHIDTLIESKRNINKDPMMRLLVEAAAAPYVLWFDDDTHVEPEEEKGLRTYSSLENPIRRPRRRDNAGCPARAWIDGDRPPASTLGKRVLAPAGIGGAAGISDAKLRFRSGAAGSGFIRST